MYGVFIKYRASYILTHSNTGRKSGLSSMLRILKIENPNTAFQREIVCPSCARTTRFQTTAPFVCDCGTLFVDAFELENNESARQRYSLDIILYD